MTNQLKSISAFFPAYNDEGTIQLMVDRLSKTLKEITKDYEIIIVDDCSPDKSGEIADTLAKKDKRISVIHHKKNEGYGGALRSGFKAAKKEWVFYTDGDAQYDVSELKKFIPFTDKFCVINGYKNFNRADGVHRKYISIIYDKVIRILFDIRKIKEIDCDFRLLKKEVLRDIDLSAKDGTICLELAKGIEDSKHAVKNVPVGHYQRFFGKSQFFKPLWIMRTLISIAKKWNELVLKRK